MRPDPVKLLQSILLAAFCLASVSAQAAPTASEQVRQHLTGALRGQIKQFITASVSKRLPPTGAPTEEEIEQHTDVALKQALVRLGSEFTLSEEIAQRLLTKGPDDTDNAAALKRNWEVYNERARILPLLLKHFHEEFDAGRINGGWDLEVARRVSDALVAEVRRHKESPKPNQRTPSISPGGKFVLTVPIERDPTDRNLPFWRVTISDASGKQLYKDDSKFIGTLNVYWCWDSADRVWLYNSDNGAIYVWQLVDGQWRRSRFTEDGPLQPPDELLPDYERKRKK